jgi:tRNA threonylcarbamoyladenosine biosynthesis protein TsaB
MRNLLAIETSGAACSVCLAIDGTRFSRVEHVGRGHNERLLPMLSALCDDAGLETPALGGRLQAVAFGCGPGSFTGVRIAAATAQAVALGWSLDVVRVPSSAALARRALAGVQGIPRGVVSLIRSRADLYYLAEYERNGTVLTLAEADRLLDASPPATWYREREGWIAAGARPPWWQGEEPIPAEPHAEQVLEIGEELLVAGEAVDAALGLPEYVGGDTPWRSGT